MTNLSHWKLLDTLSLRELVCLAVGQDPSLTESFEYPKHLTYFPLAAAPLFRAAEYALQDGTLSGSLEYRHDDIRCLPLKVIDIDETTAKRDDFGAWLTSKGHHAPFFHGTPAKEGDSFKTIERKTALKLIIGMAVGGYGHHPMSSRSDTVSTVKSDLDRLGMGLNEDTIRKWLKEAAEFLPADALSDPD